MKAITRDRYGEADVLELREVDRPTPAAAEVLVRIHAAGLDRGVWHLMAGLPYPVRLAGYGVRTPKDRGIGLDAAGVVEAVGPDVTRFKAGDEVFGIGKATYAEYACLAENKLVPKPARIGFEQAAAVPISGLTALQAVRDQAQVQQGDRVLVIGASGGVGSYAVQVAKASGAEVTGVSSGSKTDFVRKLGADHVLDYRMDDFADSGPYDVILDTGGHATLRRLRRALTAKGTLVIIGSETGGRWLGGTDRQLRAMLMSRFVSHRLRTFVSSENLPDLLALNELIETGKLQPPVDRTFRLSEVADALRYLTSGQVRGKVVILPAG